MVAGERGLAPRHRTWQLNGHQWLWLQKLGRTESLSWGSGDFMKDAPVSRLALSQAGNPDPSDSEVGAGLCHFSPKS